MAESKTNLLESKRLCAKFIQVLNPDPKIDLDKDPYNLCLRYINSKYNVNWTTLQTLKFEDLLSFDIFQIDNNPLISDHYKLMIRQLDELEVEIKSISLSDDPFSDFDSVSVTNTLHKMKKIVQTQNDLILRRCINSDAWKWKEFEFNQDIESSSMVLWNYYRLNKLDEETPQQVFKNWKDYKSASYKDVVVKQKITRNKFKHIFYFLLATLIIILSNPTGYFKTNLTIITNTIMFGLMILSLGLSWTQKTKTNTMFIKNTLRDLIFIKLISINTLLKVVI